MIRNSIFIILLVAGTFVVDIPTMFLLFAAYWIGTIIVRQVNPSYYRLDSIKIYQTIFIFGFTYLLICYSYMLHHNYNHLLAEDTIAYFLPRTEQYLKSGDYSLVLSSVWKDYNFLHIGTVGFFTYSTFWGYLSEMIGGNLYVSIQISTLFVSSFIGIVLYRLLIINNIEQQNSFQFAVIISLVSILFFYSTQILRDSHIALFYLSAIYISFKKYSFTNLLILLGIVVLIWTFRLESGLFAILYIPLYLFLSLESSKAKTYIIMAVLFAAVIGLSVILYNNYDSFISIYEANREVYALGIEDSGGIIAKLQSLPTPAAEVLSIIYNAIQPIPVWSKMSSDYYFSRPESYNIMNFPLILSSFFNWMAICYLSIYLISKEIRHWSKQNISRPLKYNILVSTVFLFLQSEVITQRRLMAIYCIFYILAILIFSQMEEKEKRKINIAILASFTLVQIIGALYINSPG